MAMAMKQEKFRYENGSKSISKPALSKAPGPRNPTRARCDVRVCVCSGSAVKKAGKKLRGASQDSSRKKTDK